MLKQFNQGYFALDTPLVLREVFDSCDYLCKASLILPKEVMEMKTETKPEAIGLFFNADVMEEAKQDSGTLRELDEFYCYSVLKRSD